MHQRGPHAQPRGHAAAPPKPKSTRGRGKTAWSRPFRAYVMATLLFIVALVGYYSVSKTAPLSGHQQWERKLAAINSAVVDDATRAFRASPTFLEMETLVRLTANTSAALEARLDDLTAAEEMRDKGVQTMADAPTATTSAKKALGRVAGALESAGDELYKLIDGMFLGGEDDAPLHEMPKGLPRSTFALFATTLHLHGSVFPEYYLAVEDERAHARSLVRALKLLDWSTDVPNPMFFNWTSDPCRKVQPGATTKWIDFCRSSLSSVTTTETRGAAILEELIALYSDYAPFRLHYAATLTLLPASSEGGPDSGKAHPGSLQSIRSARKAWAAYERSAGSVGTDATTQDRQPLSREMALLDLLEAYAWPLATAEDTVRDKAIMALTVLDSCEQFTSLVPRSAQWPLAPFTNERRPPLTHPAALQRLLVKIDLVVGDRYPGAFREAFASCMGL